MGSKEGWVQSASVVKVGIAGLVTVMNGIIKLVMGQSGTARTLLKVRVVRLMIDKGVPAGKKGMVIMAGALSGGSWSEGGVSHG